jgi:hypothetical protein
VRYISLTLVGETKRYYHYQTADDGTYDYYDETGKSAKKFPGAQTGRDRHHAFGLRRAKSPAAALYEVAYRRRLGGAARHADLAAGNGNSSTRSESKAATANMSASAIPTATRQLTAT